MKHRADVPALPEIEKPRVGIQTPVPCGTRVCPTLLVAAVSVLRAPRTQGSHPMGHYQRATDSLGAMCGALGAHGQDPS